MIPHYITNHSTHYEQSLYLQMKRIASEAGTCWASPVSLGKRMGASANTVKKYRKKLLKRGWIRKIGEKKIGKTGQVIGEYEIVDLWKLNIDFYNKLKVSGVDTLAQRCQEMIPKVSGAGAKEESIKKKQYVSKKADPSFSLEVKELFDYYIEQYQKNISSKKPLFNWGVCTKLVRPSLKSLGLDRMKKLMDAYLGSRDKFYKENAYSLSCFLSVKILHQLNAKF